MRAIAQKILDALDATNRVDSDDWMTDEVTLDEVQRAYVRAAVIEHERRQGDLAARWRWRCRADGRVYFLVLHELKVDCSESFTLRCGDSTLDISGPPGTAREHFEKLFTPVPE
jgi:hypothetical protein